MTRDELYSSEFKVRRNAKTNKFWIHWAPFGFIYGTITGPFPTYCKAFEAGVDQVHEYV